MEDFSDYEMIKGGQSVDQSQLNQMREQFVSRYCKSKGWDANGLTPDQLNEITSQREYTNPNMILG